MNTPDPSGAAVMPEENDRPSCGPAAGDDWSDGGRDARLWVKTLSEFLTDHLPSDADAQRVIPYGVQSARNLALAAAFERIEQICASDLSPPAAVLGSLPMDSLSAVPKLESLEPSEN